MKTKVKKPSPIQQIFNFFLAFGMLTLLLGPVSVVEAQGGEPATPLSPGLTWDNLGSVERAFSLNDGSVTLAGTGYQAKEAFNLEASPEIAAYYSTTSLAASGWQKISTTPHENGVTSVYSHSAGVYAVVEFLACEGDASSACLTVWQSDPTDVVLPAAERAQAQAVGTVSKSSPANDAKNVDTTVTLSWNAYTGTDLSRYRFCIDTSNNSQCDSAGGWTAVWSGRSVTVSGLAPNTKYYWQVQAVLDDETKVDANSGTWWSFTTKGSSTVVPGAFVKTLPANGAAGQSITPTMAWQTSVNASSYDYCIDTINNGICDTNWVSTTANSVTMITGLTPGTYYWQVRSVNAAGITYADTGNWYSFTAIAGPANDTIDNAAAISAIPAENILNTTAATLDTGTANACSPALGLASVWYKYMATANRKLYFDTFGTSYDTFIAVWVKNANGLVSLVTCNDNALNLAQSSINLSVTNGNTYYIQIAQKNSGATTVAAPGGSLHFNVRTFADVPANNIFWKSIEGLAAAGITGGCATSPDVLYCPTANVTRASMAVFLLRAVHSANYAPPGVGATTGFSDVPVNYWAAAWIKQLAAEGITTGCSPTNFCPESPVTRAQMAIFLLRAKHGSGYVPPAVGATTGFADVPTNHWAAAWIKQLAAENVTSGCGNGNFCPDGTVTREQMAAFLSRTFNIAQRP